MDASTNTPMNGGMLNEHLAATMTGLAVTTLRQWRVQGKGPAFAKLGRRVLYKASDVQAWIDANIFSSTTAAQQSER